MEIKTEHKVSCIDVSSDGLWIAYSSHQYITIWSVVLKRPVQTLKQHSFVTNVAFSKNGQWLASASVDNTIRIWDTALWNNIQILKEHKMGISCLAFSFDGKWLASGGSHDKTVKIWNTNTWKLEKTLNYGYIVSSVAFFPNNLWIACAGDFPMTQIWKISDWQPLQTLRNVDEKTIFSLAISMDGKWLVNGCENEVKFWNTNTWNY